MLRKFLPDPMMWASGNVRRPAEHADARLCLEHVHGEDKHPSKRSFRLV